MWWITVSVLLSRLTPGLVPRMSEFIATRISDSLCACASVAATSAPAKTIKRLLIGTPSQRVFGVVVFGERRRRDPHPAVLRLHHDRRDGARGGAARPDARAAAHR